jgi:hypothetical protein
VLDKRNGAGTEKALVNAVAVRGLPVKTKQPLSR